ncbi:MAG: N-acetylmuramoyl-L-alanine amidase [candidate division Zixibacteria bacterium]|nr:N-acetylmuramoyl-L-alanine amidase [candidate division Zixibacteria bacterium]
MLMVAVFRPAARAKSITVTVSGATEKIDAFDEKNVTYFSLSGLVDIMGGVLDWKMIGHTVTFADDTSRFEFVINSPFFNLNDSTYNLTYPAVYNDGQLYLPAVSFIPFLDRVLTQKITWLQDRATIRVDSEYFNVVDFGVAQKANGLLVEIFLTQALAYDIFVTEGNWVNVSIRDGKINSPRILSRRDSRFMYTMKAHQVEGAGQISFRLKRNVEKWRHNLADDPPRIQISIADLDFELDTSTTGRPLGPDNRIDVIVIDPGHGGGDYGAIGPNGAREKDVALDIAKELAKLIRKDKQFKVIMTRDRDKALTLDQRADIANNAGADLFISLHANASVKRNVRGWNVFFLAEAKNDSARAVAQLENSVFFRENDAFRAHQEGQEYGGANDPILSIINEMIMTEFQAESHDFAMMVDREFRRQLDIPARGVDQAGFFVLNMVFTPSVLIESGFVSNKQEEKLLKSNKYHKKVAEAIYQALKRFKAKYEG